MRASHLVSLKNNPRFHHAPDNTLFYSSIFLYQLPLSYAFRSSFVFIAFQYTHFSAFPLSSDSPPSRPLSQSFVISLQPSCVHFCLSDPLCHCLPFFVSNPLGECLSSTSLFAPRLLSLTHRSLSLSITLSMPCFFPSFSL